MTKETPPPLLEWNVEGRSVVAGMRLNTVFVRVDRVIEAGQVRYRVHFTFPLPRGVRPRDLHFGTVDAAKMVAEDLFAKWLMAVDLTPPAGLPIQRERVGHKA